MQKIIWTILLAIMLTSPAFAVDKDQKCKGHYASMPTRVRNHLPALILNAKDKGKDVFRLDDAVLIADKIDDCTITYRYHEHGEQALPTCVETITLCSTAASSATGTLENPSKSERQKEDADAIMKKAWEEKEQVVRELEEEQRRKWEGEDDLEEFIHVAIKFRTDSDKEGVLADVKSVGGELITEEDKRWHPRVIEIKIRREKKKDLIKKLKANRGVETFYKSNWNPKSYGTPPNDRL
jgi:hypothetical protein